MPRQKVGYKTLNEVDHKTLDEEGIYINAEFIPFTLLWRKLRQTREELNEKLDEVAKKLGITPSGLSRLERSQSVPNSDILGRVIRYIYGDVEVRFSPSKNQDKSKTKVDALEGIRHLINSDSNINKADRQKLLNIYSVIYKEFSQQNT
ncbi:MAG TPA: XRE family transcriptional regulator [Trueperaceae bacterium]|nr:XRE family transcriptional regulator [Trueperaceae bacterium]